MAAHSPEHDVYQVLALTSNGKLDTIRIASMRGLRWRVVDSFKRS